MIASAPLSQKAGSSAVTHTTMKLPSVCLALLLATLPGRAGMLLEDKFTAPTPGGRELAGAAGEFLRGFGEDCIAPAQDVHGHGAAVPAGFRLAIGLRRFHRGQY